VPASAAGIAAAKIFLRDLPAPAIESPVGRKAHCAGGPLSANPGIGASRGDDRPAELPALTSLRGLAALAVLLSHDSFVAFRFAGGAPPGIWRYGLLAVDLFFFLSGFVLTHVYGSRLAEERSWRAFGRFLWARFCRIYPASLFTIAVFVLAFTVGRLPFPAGVSFKAQLAAVLLLMQVPWLNDIVINSPSWSISAELYAYLLFPFIVPIILRLKAPAAAALGVVLLIGIVVDHMIFSHNEQTSGWGALLRALPEFTAGVFAYRAYSERLFRKIWEKDATLIGVIAMIIAACFAGGPDSLIVMLMLALLLASVCNSGRMAGFLNARPLRWLGEVSYSVYIFQMLPFMLMVGISGEFVAHGLGGVRYEAIAALLAIGGGVLVHRCVDVPARAALRRLPDRVMAFAAAYRSAETRPAPLMPAPAPERDR
jgi:peptidoglycan/LPS O-acetylase OafA/YrhL